MLSATRWLLFTLLVPAGLAGLLEAPRPPGVSLDVSLQVGEVKTQAALHMKLDGDALFARVELLDGPRAGQRALAIVGRAEGADRFYAYRPSLGVSALRAAQLDRQLVDVGLSLPDLVQVLFPERMGGVEAWSSEGDSLLGPADAAGCRDRFRMAEGPLPAEVTLCADEPWGARTLQLSEPFQVGAATLPGALTVTPEQGASAQLTLRLAAEQRWSDAALYTREGLGAP